MKKRIFLMLLCICFSAVALFAEVGVTDNEILIGSALALEGSNNFLGNQYKIGYETYMAKINAAGGINGRKIKTIFVDDSYEPDKCSSVTKKLIEENKVFALTCYVGTPTAKIIMPTINATKIPLVGLLTGGEVFRNPVQRYIINVRASYNMECEEIVKGFVDNLGKNKIAIFYQNDAFGLAGIQGLTKALKARGLEITSKASYERGSVDVKEAVDTLKADNPDLVVMFGTYSACAAFVKQAKAAGMKSKFHSCSFVGPEEFLRELGPDGEGVIITQVVPIIGNDRIKMPVTEWYLEDMKKYASSEKTTSVSLEGYLNAIILCEGIKRAGTDLTREKLIDSIETIQPGQIGTGVKISFGATDHQGADKVFSTIIKGGKFEYIVDYFTDVK